MARKVYFSRHTLSFPFSNFPSNPLKVKMSLLVLNGTEQDIAKLIEPFARGEKNLFFYTVTIFENELQWHQVIALRNGFSINTIQGGPTGFYTG